MKAKFLTLFLLFSMSSFAQKSKQNDFEDSTQSISYSAKIDTVINNIQPIIVRVEGERKDWKDITYAFLLALLVAIIAYYGVIKQSRASSISGFRVNWIEDLRVSYSKFLIALRNVDSKIRSGVINPRVYIKDSDEEDLQFYKTKIKLLLNNNPTTNSEHVNFYTQLVQYMEAHKEYYRGDMTDENSNAIEARKAQMEEVLSNIFKEEWEKAKKFE